MRKLYGEMKNSNEFMTDAVEGGAAKKAPASDTSVLQQQDMSAPAKAAKMKLATGRTGAANGKTPAAASDIVGVAMIALFECGLVAAGLYLGWHIAWILAGHFTIFIAALYWIYLSGQKGADISAPFLAALATLGFGPLGGLGALVVTVMGRREEGTAQLLEEWYERISHSTDVDKVTQFCDMVAVGRAINLGGPAPPSFSTVMQDGSLRDKQNALGLVARKFHPDYLPALQSALHSDQPVIRVQAAAVAAHVRDPIKKLVHELIGQLQQDDLREQDDLNDKGPAQYVSLARQLEQCLTSGLLDEGDRAACRLAIDQITDRVQRQIEGEGDGHGKGGLGTGAQDAVLVKGPVSSELSGKRTATLTSKQSGKLLGKPTIGPTIATTTGSKGLSAAVSMSPDEVLAYEALLLKRGAFGAFRALREEAAKRQAGFRRIRPLSFSGTPKTGRGASS